MSNETPDGLWQNWQGDYVKMPPSYVSFAAEYDSLCRKHGLMILSEGEEVEIGKSDESLWGFRKSTASRIGRNLREQTAISLARYQTEYRKRYGTGDGPSHSSFCGVPGRDKNCGCWVHRLLEWDAENSSA